MFFFILDDNLTAAVVTADSAYVVDKNTHMHQLHNQLQTIYSTGRYRLACM